MSDKESFTSLLDMVESHLSRTSVSAVASSSLPSLSGLPPPPAGPRLPRFDVRRGDVTDTLAQQLRNMLVAQGAARPVAPSAARLPAIDLSAAILRPGLSGDVAPRAERLLSCDVPVVAKALETRLPPAPAWRPAVTRARRGAGSSCGRVLSARARPVAAPYLRAACPTLVSFDFSSPSPCDEARRRRLHPPRFTQVVELEDGGRLALDWVCVEGGGGAGGVLVLVPGMTGGTQAEYVRCVAAAARALGAGAVVVNHRGTGAPLATPRLYSALSHGDLAAALAAVEARARGPLLGVGVSLGGLILGQYLAAWGGRARLAAALAVSAPLDVERAAAAMERAANAPLAWHMARNMRAAVRAQPALARHHAAVARARTLRQFDAAFTAAHVGFRSVEEYYAAATLRGKLGAVRAPLLCLCAADDPFQPRGALPAREAAASARVALAVTARGGHIGFLEGWPRAAADTFLARLTRDYFAALLARPALLHRAP